MNSRGPCCAGRLGKRELLKIQPFARGLSFQVRPLCKKMGRIACLLTLSLCLCRQRFASKALDFQVADTSLCAELRNFGAPQSSQSLLSLDERECRGKTVRGKVRWLQARSRLRRFKESRCCGCRRLSIESQLRGCFVLASSPTASFVERPSSKNGGGSRR